MDWARDSSGQEGLTSTHCMHCGAFEDEGEGGRIRRKVCIPVYSAHARLVASGKDVKRTNTLEWLSKTQMPIGDAFLLDRASPGTRQLKELKV